MQRISLDARDYYPVLDQRRLPALVVFTAPACGACRRLKQVLAAMTPPLPGLEVFEVQAEQAGGLLEDLEIFHLPAIFLYTDGDHHAPVQAVLHPHTLTAAIQTAAAGPRQEPP